MPKRYSENDIARAIEMVENGTKTKNAAEICKVPRTTLIGRMKVSNKVLVKNYSLIKNS